MTDIIPHHFALRMFRARNKVYRVPLLTMILSPKLQLRIYIQAFIGPPGKTEILMGVTKNSSFATVEAITQVLYLPSLPDGCQGLPVGAALLCAS
jgi:hypothetical protein